MDLFSWGFVLPETRATALMWQGLTEIELFFKWIKQNLKIKRFVGHSENAVLIQVLVAMIAYLLMKLSQLRSASPLTMQKIARLLSLNITSRKSLDGLLHPKFDSRKRGKPDKAHAQLDFEWGNF